MTLGLADLHYYLSPPAATGPEVVDTLDADDPRFVTNGLAGGFPADDTSRHYVVVLGAGRSIFETEPVTRYDVFSGDETEPLTPISTDEMLLHTRVFVGYVSTPTNGSQPWYGYVYVLPGLAPDVGEDYLWFSPADGTIPGGGLGGVAVVQGMADLDSYPQDLREADTVHEFDPVTGGTAEGLWLQLAWPALDSSVVTTAQSSPSATVNDGTSGFPGPTPQIVEMGVGSSSSSVSWELSESVEMFAWPIQLLGESEPTPPTDGAVPLAGAVSGSIAEGPFGAVTGVAIPPVAAHVVTVDNPYVSVGTLDESFGRSWQDQVSEPGSGVVQMDNEDPDLALIDENALIRFELNGRAEFLMIPNIADRVSVAPGEEADQITTVTGPGNLAILANAVVYPSRGTGSVPIEEDRVFSWPSPDFDDTSWGTATALMSVDAARESWPAIPFGEGFPESSSAMVIWSPPADPDYPSPDFTHPDGDCYFRSTVYFPSNGRVVVYALIDNYGEVYFDGQPVMIVSPSDGFSTVTAFGLDVSLGEHTIAVRGHNGEDDAEPGYNPGAVAIAIYDADINNQPLSSVPIWVTDGSMKLVAYPPSPPGMTPGEVALILLDEALARDALPIGTLWRTFDRDTDSNGNPWPVVGEIATKVGTDYLTFFREMSATYFDMWMSPAGFDLNLFSLDGQGLETDIDWHPPTDELDPTSGNIEHLQHTRAT